MVTYIDATKAPLKANGQIRLYGAEAFAAMRLVGQVTAMALDAVADLIQPNVPTADIDAFLFEFGAKHNAVPATLNYRGYRYSSCISINHVVCHGLPGEKPLRDGDIVNVDVTYVLDGWHGDSSRMYLVGDVKRGAARLCEVTHEALMRGISVVRPGVKTGAIGAAIQNFAEAERCSVVRDFCGHGVGQLFHDAPNILHYGSPNEGVELREGMIFTIEPMINLGRPHVKVLADGWTAVTRDRTLSAQYEHMLGVTSSGYEIFTLSPKGLHRPGIDMIAA